VEFGKELPVVFVSTLVVISKLLQTLPQYRFNLWYVDSHSLMTFSISLGFEEKKQKGKKLCL
jgi:hypothetical protein